MADKMRKVLLFSTGLDSFVLSKLETYDAIVFIKTGVSDNVVELSRLQTHFADLEAIIVDLSFLAQFELPNKIIPFRNHIFVCVAAQFGQDIYLASTAGDTTRDKDEQFAGDMSKALTYFATGPIEKVLHPGPRKVWMPLRKLTKVEIVKLYLLRGFPAEDLVYKSTSCYHPTSGGQECGVCRSCLRKFVALSLNEISPAFPPPSQKLLEEHLMESIYKGRRGEAQETEAAICRLPR